MLYGRILRESSEILDMLYTELLYIIHRFYRAHFIAERETQRSEAICPGNEIQTQLCPAPRSYSLRKGHGRDSTKDFPGEGRKKEKKKRYSFHGWAN